MNKFIPAVLAVLSTCALASTAEELEAASNLALANARNLSAEGNYAAAAAAVKQVLTTFKPKIPADERYKLDSLATAIGIYEARAEAAKGAATNAVQARALLTSLIQPGFYAIEFATPGDTRVAVLLAQLRKIDPKATKFFAPRPVRVVVTGDALSVADADALVEGVVGPLRALGFVASAREGTETLSLAVKLGDVVKDIGKGSYLAGALPDKSESCELKVDATWTVGETQLIRIDLSKRGIGFSDIPGQCVRARVKEIPELVAPRLVKRWDSDYAP